MKTYLIWISSVDNFMKMGKISVDLNLHQEAAEQIVAISIVYIWEASAWDGAGGLTAWKNIFERVMWFEWSPSCIMWKFWQDRNNGA